MNTNEEIQAAISNQGSPEHNTPSGPILTLMHELARRGDLAAFSNAFTTFAGAKPTNVPYVENRAPGMILNQYLFAHLGLTVEGFSRWERANADWAATIKQTLRNPVLLAQVVCEMAEGIQKATLARNTPGAV